jgi:hypothetical protein
MKLFPAFGIIQKLSIGWLQTDPFCVALLGQLSSELPFVMPLAFNAFAHLLHEEFLHKVSYKPGLCCIIPPSTITVVAVIYEAASLAKKATIWEISSGSAIRPNGMAALNFFINSGSFIV